MKRCSIQPVADVTLATPEPRPSAPPAVSAASDVPQGSLRASSLRLELDEGSGIPNQNEGATVDLFSRSGMNLIGVLLLLLIACAIYAM